MDSLQNINLLLDHPKFSTVSSLILALYAGMAAPALPNSVILFFDTIPGKILFLFLIGFMASRNIQVALMIAVAFVVTLHVANQRTTEQYINFMARERFYSGGPGADADNIAEFENDAMSENYITDEQTEQFRNYRLEGFEGDEDIAEDLGVNGDDEGEDVDVGAEEVGAEGSVEGGGVDGEDEDVAVVAEDAGAEHMDDIEEFYSPVTSSNHFSSVKPAHNLAGNSSEMFAPVNFN
tara:strand:- start:4634 stop:5344 length:711 start_codon:yes stop_codon:yes gene_type:complete